MSQRACPLRVAIIYPGPADQGRASLAVCSLLRLAGELPGIRAERVFVGPGARPSEPLSAFDLLAVSLSFEEQYAVLPGLLRQGGLPALARERDARFPLVLAGGLAVRLNPRPLRAFADLLVPGDAEAVIGPLLAALSSLRGAGRPEQLAGLARVEGVWSRAAPDDLRPVYSRPARPAAQVGPAEPSALGDLFLVETGRGCPRRCRFCALSHARRPAIFFPVERIFEAARPGIESGRRIGLVGASLGMHPDLPALLDRLAAHGADLSPASLHPAAVVSDAGRSLVGRLAEGRQRSITLAPEAGSARLRRLIGKPCEDDALHEAVGLLASAGCVHLKLYLMYGLPTERDEDLEASVELLRACRRIWLRAHGPRGGTGRIGVSLNPFVPKPCTPLAAEAMPALAELRRRRRFLASRMRRLGGVDVSGFSPREALLQCFVDRSGEELSALLLACDGRWPPPAELLRELSPSWRDLACSPGAEPREPWGEPVESPEGAE
ncbi:MAG: radical SAM protein [Deltaproteobacteria bacterium]|nr:radical SAM protein [Deltaproteobacteria bacterium]